MTTRIAPLFALVALVACNNDSGFSRVTHTDTFFQEKTNQVDILWVVDNSLSMGNEQEELIERFKDFIASMDSSSMEWHVGVVTTDVTDEAASGRLQGDVPYITPDTAEYEKAFKQTIRGLGLGGSSKEAGIEAALLAVTEPLKSTDNAGFIRDEAKLNIIYVSDENDCTNDGSLDDQESEACYYNSELLVPVVELVDRYKTQIKTDDTRIVVSSIVGPSDVNACEDAVPGTRYHGMSEAFGGLIGSICAEDFTTIMSELGLQSAGLLTSFILEYEAVEDTLEVFVDDVVVAADPTNGWVYDATYSVLYFYGTAVPDYGSTITVRYEVAGSRAEDTATTE